MPRLPALVRALAAGAGLGAALAAPASGEPASAAAGDAPIADASTEDEPRASLTLDSKGLRGRSADGNFTLRIGGRLHADASTHAGDDSLSPGPTNGTEIRRARIDLRGTVYRDFGFMAEVDFAGDEVAIKDFWLGFRGFERASIRAGNLKQPYSLAVEMSSNDLPFVERSLDAELVLPFDRAIGVRIDAHGEHWFTGIGWYGESVSPNTSSRNEGFSTAGRVILAPVLEEDRLVHLGFRTAFRQTPSGARSSAFSDETTNMSNLAIVDTGTIPGVRNQTNFGPEAAIAIGPFSLTGEYNRTHLGRVDDTAPGLDFQSAHIAATWSLTGESRAEGYAIDRGEFKRLVPAEDFRFRAEGCGAFELAARWAWLDLADGPVQAGEQQRVYASLNWYANRNVRVLLDWSYVLDVRNTSTLAAGAAGTAGEGLSTFTFRAQITF